MWDILKDNWLLLLIGQYPHGPIGGLAATLGLAVGGTLHTQDGTALKVVGLVTDPGRSDLNGFLDASFFERTDPGTWIFKAAPGVSPEMLATRLAAAAGTGDVTIQTAEVVDKMVDEEGRHLVQVKHLMKNQKGTTMCTGVAEIALPKKD